MTDGMTASLVLGAVIETQSTVEGLKVRLQRLDRPAGVETDWISIATPMAGNGAGLSFMPEVGDLAVVAFNGTRPIVLGFVFGGDTPVPTTDANERIIQSVDGNALVLVDGDESGIVLRDKHSNEIAMTADGISITTPNDLTIEAGGTTTIVGATVELNP